MPPLPPCLSPPAPPPETASTRPVETGMAAGGVRRAPNRWLGFKDAAAAFADEARAGTGYGDELARVSEEVVRGGGGGGGGG